MPPTAVSKEALERARAAIGELQAGAVTEEKAADDFRDIIDLFFLLMLDLEHLQKYALDSDAALRGCVSDAPAIQTGKETPK